MKSKNLSLNERNILDRVSYFKIDKFTLEFKFKHLNFYNRIYYLRKIKIFDSLLSDVKKLLNFKSKKKNLNFSILLTNDAEIKEINYKYRKLNKPTNVLSFKSMIDDNNYFKTAKQEVYLGEIIISMERILNESRENDISFKNHFVHIFLHAILHILGYDHETDSEREKMENIEITMLKNLGIKNPYA